MDLTPMWRHHGISLENIDKALENEKIYKSWGNWNQEHVSSTQSLQVDSRQFSWKSQRPKWGWYILAFIYIWAKVQKSDAVSKNEEKRMEGSLTTWQDYEKVVETDRDTNF